jgi:hypothetical protein
MKGILTLVAWLSITKMAMARTKVHVYKANRKSKLIRFSFCFQAAGGIKLQLQLSDIYYCLPVSIIDSNCAQYLNGTWTYLEFSNI